MVTLAYCIRVTVNHYLISDGVGVFNACRIFACIVLKDELCLPSLMHCQLASKDTLRMASRPKTSCVGVARVAVCTAHRIACRTAERIPDDAFGR